jgi:hypothetical protein
VVYYDADGDGDPTNAVRIGSDDLVTITTLGDFETYPTNFAIPAAGDVYIGFVDQWAIDGGYLPALAVGATDSTAPHGKSFISGASYPPTDITDLANNDQTFALHGVIAGNLLIRATGTGSAGSIAPCTAGSADWLRVVEPIGSGVAGGESTDVYIFAGPFQENRGLGTYTAQLCITTNDPAQPVITVPVSMTVTAATCPGVVLGEIFCDGFDGSEEGKRGMSDLLAEAGFQAKTFDRVKGNATGSLTLKTPRQARTVPVPAMASRKP